MKFSTKEDIEAPLAFVFAELTDFESFELTAMRRGAEVVRLDRLAQPGKGMAWTVEFRWRGRHRKLLVDLQKFEPGNAMAFLIESPGFEVTLELSFVEMSRRRTRLGVEFEVRPRTLAARLMLQSLKLGKAKLDRKFTARVRALAADIETRFDAGR